MAAAAAVGCGTTAVFEKGPLNTKVIRPISYHNGQVFFLTVATPTEAGTYPVLVFLHGYAMFSWWYSSLLEHVASHGFILVAPLLHDLGLTDKDDIETTKAPDLTRLALAGHSRGGDTAFAVAHPIPLDLKFSALIGVDPVAGLGSPDFLQVKPRVLTGSFDPGMPVMVIGTGLGPEFSPGGLFPPRLPSIPCAPNGVNHVEFYDQCTSKSRYHLVAKDYGHLDMLDDAIPALICKSCQGPEHTKELCRRTMAGLMVAFLKDKLRGEGHDLQAVLDNPGLAPADLLHPVEHA
ncbi:unnamed protein product [Urochloa decumbens]|uniref:Chlorophyllase n=1 Tax=Urochloa decumbens TaxID=240449 RepID=A0ABC9H3N0_9POAL